MAFHKFKTPTFTQTPNEFFDDMAKTLKEGELRVILVLMRQTFGWKKNWDRISLSQLEKKTGMERKSVCRSLASLIEKGYVLKKKFGEIGQEKCWYCLAVEEEEEEYILESDGYETDEEREFFKINNTSVLKTPPQCPKDTPPSVLKTPTKETLTKENIKRNDDGSKIVVVFLSIKKLNISEQDARSICSRYSEFEVDTAVGRVLKWPNRESDIKALNHVLKNPESWKDVSTKEEIEKENEGLLRTLDHLDGKEFKGAKITVSNRYIEFSCGMKIDIFRIDDPKFREKVVNFKEKLHSSI